MGILRNILSVISFSTRKNSNCPVIFLDFDGVLSTDDYLDQLRAANSKTHDYFGRLFDPECISCLRRIIKSTGARIVITSSWRNYLSTFQFILMWHIRKLPGILAGVVPQGSAYRGNEIDEWLKQHTNISRYAILDDMDSRQFKSDQSSHLVTTNHFKGLQPEHLPQTLSILAAKHPS